MTRNANVCGPSTYRELWDGLGDTVLDYDAFYKLFPPHGDSADMVSHLFDSSPTTSPMGVLLLVSFMEGDHFVVPVHSVEKVRTSPRDSLWKAQVCIDGDLHPLLGGTTMRRLDRVTPSMFDTLHDVLVPTVAGFAKRRKTDSNWSNGLLKPVNETESDVERVTVLKCCPVPLELLEVLVGMWYRPVDLYDAIDAWNKARANPIKPEECWPLLWARVASVQQLDTDGTETNPPCHLGLLDSTLPPLRLARPDEAAYMVNRLKQDLPGFDQQPAGSRGDRLRDLAAALERRQRVVRASAVANAPERTWQAVNPYSYESLCLLQKTTDECEFSKGLQTLIKYPQKEWRAAMEQALSAAGGNIPGGTPVVTKRLVDSVTRGQWCTKSTERGHYELGVSIFSLVLPTSPLGKSLRDKNLLQDAVDGGTVQVNVDVIKDLAKSEVTLIRDTTSLDFALSMMCTFLKVYEEGEHAQSFERFHRDTWPLLRRLLDTPGDVVPSDIEEPVLLIACHIAKIMNRYWTELELGRKPNLPAYATILTIVDERKWYLIQHDIPNHYLTMLAKLKSNQNGTIFDD